MMTSSKVILVALGVAVNVSRAALQEPVARPTLEEWKEGQANATASKVAVVANKSKMAAVDKVLALLSSLQKQVLEEGEKEAQTYNNFSCFCSDTSKEKTTAIQKGTDEQASLTAIIAELSEERVALDKAISGLVADIDTAEKTITAEKARRTAELKAYEVNTADLIGALDSLENAIKALESSKAPALLQLQGISKTLRGALLMADAMGLNGVADKVSSFLQQAPDVPMEDYKFHSNDIITTLENLLKAFQSEKANVDAEEVKAVATFDSLIQEQSDIVKQKNIALEQAKEDRARKQESIAASSQELTTVSALVLDDKSYLSELASLCSKKAQTWDQRSQVRGDELSALAAAISIIAQGVQSKTSSATMRLAQQGTVVHVAEAMAMSPAAMEALESEVEGVEAAAAPSFLQLLRFRGKKAFLARSKAPDSEAREAVANLLHQQGERLKSSLLSTMASQVQSDPLGKVKVLIQELIERLLKEEANEANQKGWCDKALSDAEQKRNYSAIQVEDLNGVMAELEARLDLLRSELHQLNTEITELEVSRKQAADLRAQEAAEALAATNEATEGIQAVGQAIDLLSKFYKTAAKAQVQYSFGQRSVGPADDAPDAGFDITEQYVGAQGQATGILGMLSVIQSDFERTISETAANEAKAKQEYLMFETETGKSLGEKTEAHKAKTAQKDDAEDNLEKADENLQAQVQILQTSLQELLELKPACIDTGMSYEERVARRQDEIAALNKGLCILEHVAQFGPDGPGAEC